MIDPHDFARKQMELTTEFAKFVINNPDVDESLPDGAFIFFELDGEPSFNDYNRGLAEKKKSQGMPVVLVRSKGLAPPQGSRLLDPVIEPISAMA